MRLPLLAAAALLALAAPAIAAPARDHVFDNDHLTDYAWTFGPGTGVLLDGLVSAKAPCTAVLNTCDFTLIQLGDPGTLNVTTSSDDQTVVDIDLHVFTSDADGTQGDLLGESKGGTPAEAFSEDLDPGYYLVKVDYLAGAGNYNGAATFAPRPPEEPQ